MTNRVIYKYGLYGRCPVCKQISRESCSFCDEKDYFADSGKPGHVLCTKCNTLNKVECSNDSCNFQLKVIRTPKNLDEKKRIEEFIRRKKEMKKDKRNYTINTAEKTPKPAAVPDQTEIKEMELIKDFWSKKDNLNGKTDTTPKAEKAPTQDKNERRIVNHFYDEYEDVDIDKKINFEDKFDEKVFFDCNICGKTEIPVICDKCGKQNEFSLNYDSLSCKCGNQINIANCDCGAKQGHGEFYLISDSVKWQYSQTKSYYNYRKGRMLVFSTCPTCGLFSVEKCKECGSKVNFGKPNQKNEVYCKSCGTTNQYLCENPTCHNTVKHLKNPSSIEENLDWLNDVMNVKAMAAKKKKRRLEEKKKEVISGLEKGDGEAKEKVAIGESKKVKDDLLKDSSPNFTSSFMDIIEEKNKDILSESFMSEIKEDVLKEKKIKKEVRQHNLKHTEEKKEVQKGDYTEETFYVSPKNGSRKTILVLLTAILLTAGGYLAYMYFINKQTPLEVYHYYTGKVVDKEEIGKLPETNNSDSVAASQQVKEDSLKKEKEMQPEKQENQKK